LDSNYNKFDVGNEFDTSLNYYSNQRDNYKKRQQDLPTLFTQLKLNAKPFIPKNREENIDAELQNKLLNTDPSNIKEFIPKNYKVVKKKSL